MTSCEALNPGSGHPYVTVLAFYPIPATPLSTRGPKESFQAELNLSQRSRPGNESIWDSLLGPCCPDGQGPCLCLQCTDGLDGNGTCVCQDGFQGSQCQFCSDPNKYGPRCDKSKCRFLSCRVLLTRGPCSTAVQSWYQVPLGLVDALITGYFLSTWVPNSAHARLLGPTHRALR